MIFPLRKAVLATAIIAISSTPLQAQMLEEVIVTAQKREQNLQDVPVAVSAFTGEMIEQTGAKDLFDLQANIPSLRVGQTQSSSTTTFAIRGVFTSSQNFALESSVGLYVDGAYRSRQGSMINNLVDVAAIEVLRGPQGTLFGRNSPAGAVSIYSVKPDHEGSGYIEGTYGDYNLRSGSAAISLSAIEDVLAFRVTGFGMKRDGIVDSVEFGDEKMNDRDRWGIRAQALWTPTDDLSIHIIADRSEVDEICCGTGTWKNNYVADGIPGKTGTDTIIEDVLGGTVLQAEDFYDYKISSSFLSNSSNEDQGVSAQIDWHTDAFQLTSISAYRSFDQHDHLDADFANIDALVQVKTVDQSSFSQELRISNDYDNFNYVAGVYYFTQEMDTEGELIAGEHLVDITAAFGEGFPAGTGSTNFAAQEHESYAVFGQVDYQLSDDFVLTAGLRWTREEKDLENTFIEDATPCTPFECFDFGPGWAFWLFAPTAPRDNVDENIDDTQTTGTLKLSWFANDTTMFYASYGTGYKAGGVNTDRIDVAFDVMFEAETSTALEIGMKAEFPDQALRVNLALHSTEFDDLQTSSFKGDGFVLSNAGTAEAWGGEADIFWQPTATTSLTLGYAYNKAEYSKFPGGPCWLGSPWHTGVVDPGDNGDGSCDRSGDPFSSNPEQVLVLSGNQEFILSSGITGFVYGEYIYTDERMTDINSDPEKVDGDYTLINLRAGLIFEEYDILLTAWARNLTAEEYTGTISDSVLQDGKYNAFYTEPRTWGLTLRKNW
ncbi:MAG: TonB-dependent receptor [Halieaceae bacterium]|jgi:iron complex outermembrane recepter protein|nr:TonB-dependent receptor [Halieaceae bacterium]